VTQMLTIGDISVEIASGIACALSQVVADGVLHLRPFSVTEDGRLVTSDAPRIPHSVVPLNKMRFEVGDILFNNTNSVELVGKSAVVSTGLEASFSNHMTRVRIDRRRAEPGYVQAFLRYLYGRRFFQDRATRWVSQAAFGNSQLKALEVPLPPLNEQRRIVGLLDRAAQIRRHADAARAKARAIIPALFLDTFGDPATNQKGWHVGVLGKYADVQGGVQVSAKRANLPVELPYLRVANVMRGTLSLSEIKTIRVTPAEAQRTKLVRGDVLVVEGHGNPNEIGRAAIWDDSIPDCIHQNHLIRARPDRGWLMPEYLETFLNSDVGRRILIQNGKTTSGLNTISTRNVKDVRIPLPPMSLQDAFAGHVQRLESLVCHLDAAAAKAEAIAAGLSAEAFGSGQPTDNAKSLPPNAAISLSNGNLTSMPRLEVRA
jgi:restriction endonuclease S subunit